jgi:hypothetical protein
MNKTILLVFLILISCGKKTTEKEDKDSVITILNNQANAWSEYNIEAFMEGYWKNDSLKFYGANGITYGWQNTLDNYNERYPSKEHTGKLDFKINTISKINDEAYYVMGEYYLTRKIGDANGIFMIIFKKINGKWKIISDTSC